VKEQEKKSEARYEFPASYGQQRMWLLDRLEPGNEIYNIPVAYQIKGRLNVRALQASLNQMIARHESLRTVFVEREGELQQVIGEATELVVEVEEVEGETAQQRQERAEQISRQEAARGFDLGEGPLLRVRLLRVEETEHLMILVLHHIISDGWSMGILMRELGKLYEMRSGGEAGELEELEVQYADYAVWQREWLESGELERQMEYWREQMKGAAPVLEMGSDYVRGGMTSKRGRSERMRIGEEATRKLKELSRSEGMTLYMSLLGAFDVMLWRYSGQEDIVVGTPIANRRRAEVEGVMGLFVNTLVMRVEVKGEASYRELLKKVKEVALGAYANQDVPFEKLVEELQPDRDFSRSPIFQVMFVLQTGLTQKPRMGELEVNPMPLCTTTSKFEIEFVAAETQNGLLATIQYNADIYKASTIKRMARQFERLIEALAKAPDRRLSEVELVSPGQRHQLLYEWNDTASEVAPERLIHELIEEQAGQRPDAIAVVSQEGSLSYGEMNRRANQLARYLIEEGAGAEEVVGICLGRRQELIVSLLAVLKSGAAYLPLDPTYPPSRLAAIAEAAQLKLAIANSETAQTLNTCAKRVINLDACRAAIAARTQALPLTLTSPGNLAYVIYTSGTTGKPKGVAIEHRQLVNYSLAAVERLKLSKVKRFAGTSTVAADLGNTVIYGALITGGTLHLIGEDMISDGEGLGDYFQREDIECMKIVPSHLEALVGASRQAVARKKVIVGGEAVGCELVKALREARAGVEIYNHYGPTETTVGVIAGEITTEDVDAGEAPRERIALGRPLASLRAYIFDKTQTDVLVNAIGELYIGGAGVGRGYLNEPGLTAERFVPDIHSTGGKRLYRTGDQARWRGDGKLEFLGRADGQVKLRGYRIELGEIEAALLQHDGVRQCAVIARQDDAGEKYLVAYVTNSAEAGLKLATLRNYLREKLPEYMVPSRFMILEALPLTPNGKLDRRALPIPGREEGDAAAAAQAPRTATEEVLAGIWCQVLKRERVGIEDNFFEIGGHSLIATQVVSRVREAFRIELSVRRIFELPTIVALAQEIEAAGRGRDDLAAAPLCRAPRDATLPLSFTQKGLWFFHQLEPESSYNSQVAIRFTGQLNLRALMQSLNEVMRRHEILRTILPAIEGEPIQLIQPYAAAPFPLVDLTGLPATQREALAQSLLQQESRRPFALAKGPLVRAFFLHLENDKHLLLLTMHHTVSDGWSGGVLFHELSALYTAFVAAEPSPLAELAIQYADFACWQQQWLQGAAHQRDLQYWKDQLQGAPVELGFPTDRPRPAVLDSCGALEPLRFPSELDQSLRELSRRENVSMYMTLLAAFKVLLHCYSGKTDIVIGSPIAGRNRAELEPLIGFFINTLVMRSDLSGDPSFSDLLKHVREVTLAAYLHQDMPFEKLVEELEPERSLSRTPLFQVMFALQNLPAKKLQLAGVEAERLLSEPATERFDLRLVMMETARGLVGMISYNTALFEAATIQRMIRHYKKLLETAVAAPHLRLSELDFLNESEQHQLLRERNLAGAAAAGLPERPTNMACDPQSRTELARRRAQLASRRAKLPTAKETLLKEWLQESR